jgi:hypothetical protein
MMTREGKYVRNDLKKQSFTSITVTESKISQGAKSLVYRENTRIRKRETFRVSLGADKLVVGLRHSMPRQKPRVRNVKMQLNPICKAA